MAASVSAQDSLQVNLTFTKDTSQTITYSNLFYGFRVSGSVVLNSDTSLARVILVDSNGEEHLAYEVTSQLEMNLSATFEQVGEETFYLDETTIDQLKIEIIDATVVVNKLSFLTQPEANSEEQQDAYRSQLLDDKRGKIQDYIDVNHLPWFAGITSISNMTYSEKTEYFGAKYNLLAYEFYSAGIFIDNSAKTFNESEGVMVDSFDWRKKHDANESSSVYFDGDPDTHYLNSTYHEEGNGWFTKIRGWGAPGWCWMLASADCVEAVTNIYYNQHIDAGPGLELSIQDILSKLTGGSQSGTTGDSYYALKAIKNSYIGSHSWWPFTWATLEYNPGTFNQPVLPVSPYTVSIRDFVKITNTTLQDYDDIKKNLLTKGPVVIDQDGHSMTLVGWGKIEAGQKIYQYGNGNGLLIEIDQVFHADLIGKTYWIVKQQGQHNTGIDGFGYYAYVPSEVCSSVFPRSFSSYSYIEDPSYVHLTSPITRNWQDADGDGLYNWGIGEKPESLTHWSNMLDGNDNNATYGAMAETGHLSFNLPYANSFDENENLEGWHPAIESDMTFAPIGVGGNSPYPNIPADNLNNSGEKYLRMNIAISTLPGEKGIIMSPYFTLQKYCDAQISFDYWFNEKVGNPFAGTFSVDVRSERKEQWINIYSQCKLVNAWQSETMDISGFGDELVQFRFVVDVNTSPQSTDVVFGLDNFNFTGFAHDLSSYELISTNETISEPTDKCTNVKILSGVTLTITDVLRMPISGNIFIEPGAKLVVNGGTITSVGNGLWDGIVVSGNSLENQFPSTSPAHQGYLYLNNATIENAEYGVKLVNPSYKNTSGGVIQAYNSTFKNNRTAINFLPYKNKLNGVEFDNVSKFVRCTLLIDNNFCWPEWEHFNEHVRLCGVKGVEFQSCEFYNLQDNKVYDNWNVGIRALDAGIKVFEIATGVSLIQGFNIGISLENSSSTVTSLIKDTEFKENVRGVKATGMSDISIIRNSFDLTCGIKVNEAIFEHQYLYGIDLYQSTGFQIEENDFTSNLHWEGSGVVQFGIRVNNTNHNLSDNNQIYKNVFETNIRCIHAEGINRTANGLIGLQLLCNEFIGQGSYAWRDIEIYDDPSHLGSVPEGIRRSQGYYINNNDNLAAGNFFRHFTFSGGSTSDIYENTGSSIDYFYNDDLGSSFQPIKYTSSVSPIYVNNNNQCPSNINSGIELPLDPQLEAAMKSSFLSDQTAYWNLYYSYLNQIDGGSTPAILTDIQNAWPQEAWDLRNDLMSIAPYLSREALEEAANSDVLSDAMLLEICLANPDATSSEEFIEFLLTSIPTPLPTYMGDLIRASWDDITPRTLLENGLAKFGGKMDYNMNMLLANEKFKGTQSKDSLRSLHNLRANLRDRYAIVDSYINEQNFDFSIDELNSISADFSFDDREQDEYDNFSSYHDLLYAIADDSRNIFELTTSEFDQLEQIAQDRTGWSSVKAGNILCFVYNFCFDYPPNLSTDSIPKSVIQSRYLDDKEDLSRLIINPNPIVNEATIEWSLVALIGKTIVRITDINGNNVFTDDILQRNGQMIVHLGSLNPGIYGVDISTANEIIVSKKIILQ